MTEDHDILRAAKLMIARYGKRADRCANRRGKELLVRGYIDASELWRQVIAVIEDTQHEG
jgi:hypothetical protein